VQATEPGVNSDIWSSSLTGSSGLHAAGSLDTSSQPNITCVPLQSAESSQLSLAKCMPSVCDSLLTF